MSEEETTNGSEQAEAPKKKAPRRKPVYVCVPVKPVEKKVLDDDGFEATVMTVPEGVSLYAITVCESGKGQKADVEKVLEESGIDLASGSGDALLFRADPLTLEVQMQPKLKFR